MAGGGGGRFYFIAKFAERHLERKIHFVTHSMGGIITRMAVDSLVKTGGIGIAFGRVVMFAPPNRGSMTAMRLSRLTLLRKLLRPLPELSNAPNSKINSIPIPDALEYGVITGRFDGKVSPEEAKLGCEKDYLIVNSFHSFIMNRPGLWRATAKFIESGSF